jgi:hypothetical protein
MAELTIRPDDIRDALQRFVSDYEPETATREEVGIIAEAGDGIAIIEGLPSAMANELLEFEDGTLGLALNLDVRSIGAVVLGEFSGIEEGQQVRRTGNVLSVPVGDNYLGRVSTRSASRSTASARSRPPSAARSSCGRPSVVMRQSVSEPLQTGLKAIDALTPIGRGQRQLIIGDRQTGKTAIVLDTIINQKQYWETGDPSKQVRCIYVGIGQKGSTIAAVRGCARGGRRTGVHHDRGVTGLRPGRLQVPRPLHRLRHRAGVDVRRQARADHLRRPEQAGRGLPRRVAAAAPSAGPRGLPRVTSSTCTRACWSAARSSATSSAAAR